MSITETVFPKLQRRIVPHDSSPTRHRLPLTRASLTSCVTDQGPPAQPGRPIAPVLADKCLMGPFIVSRVTVLLSTYNIIVPVEGGGVYGGRRPPSRRQA